MVLLPALISSCNDDLTCKVIGRHLMSEAIRDASMNQAVLETATIQVLAASFSNLVRWGSQ
jgi:hypothetical protein